MTIYELNQANYGKLPALDEVDLIVADQTFADFFNYHRANYYMLLNHELHYFTLFHQESPQFRHITRENVLAILQQLGEIKSIEKTDDKMGVECWVTMNNDPEDTHMFLLFDYDRGVVESK